MRTTILRLGRTRAAALGLRVLASATRHSRHRLPVLAYHRVAPRHAREDLYPGLISAHPEAFQEHVRLLADGFHPLSAADLLAVREGAIRPPPAAVVLTFDDAYQDFADHAWPILRSYGVPAILFVPTAYPDRVSKGFWWDRLHRSFALAPTPLTLEVPAGRVLVTRNTVTDAFRRVVADLKQMSHHRAERWLDRLHQQLPEPGPCHAVLSWGQLRELHRSGVTIAPHTREHPRLDRVGKVRLREEVNGSREDLNRHLGEIGAPIFAYPDGGHDRNAYQAVADAGISIAFTTERGINDVRRADWLRLRRINVGTTTPIDVVRGQMALLPALPRAPWTPAGARPASVAAQLGAG